MNKLNHRNIILIGLMGSGKTSVGTLLAEKTGRHFLDTDLHIENQEKRSIEDIINTKGEPYFRHLEKQWVKTLTCYHHYVISTGGGLPMHSGDPLKEMGIIIFLSTTLETLLKRLETDTTRPLIAMNKKETLETLLKERLPIYTSLADFTLHTDKKTPLQLVEEILKFPLF